jgi:hypothetical protein
MQRGDLSSSQQVSVNFYTNIFLILGIVFRL